jgi:ABC-type multidrug transport system ATPase subunit
MLVLSNLTKRFGTQTVLDHVSAEFRPQAANFVMGPNGAGKTTLIRCVLQLHIYQGTITWNGARIDPSRRLVCPVFDDAPFHGQLTGLQNIRVLVPEARTLNRRYLSAEILRQRVKRYSHGQRMRLALMMALESGAELIVLDEPTNGLDRDGMLQLKQDIREMKSSTTFLLTGHNLEFFDDLVDSVHLVQDGRLTALGDGSGFAKGGDSLADVYERHYSTNE